MFFCLAMTCLIWKSGNNRFARFGLYVAFGLVFFPVLNTWLVRASSDFFAFLNKLGFILNVAFWSWWVVIFYNRSWMVILYNWSWMVMNMSSHWSWMMNMS